MMRKKRYKCQQGPSKLNQQAPKKRREKHLWGKTGRDDKRHGQHSYMMKIITLKNTTCIQFSRFNLIN